MTENWRVKTARSFALGLPPKSRFFQLPPFFSCSFRQQDLLSPHGKGQRAAVLGNSFTRDLFTLAISSFKAKSRHLGFS